MKLALLIAQYVAFRKNLGVSFENDARLLQSFSRTIGETADISGVQADRVKAFLDGCGPITCYWHRKHTALRGFYRYAVSRGYVAATPLPAIIPQQPERFVPYIYSCEELQRLLDATNSYQKQRIQMEPHTFRTILLALYGAALREGECLSLTLSDVDLRQSLLSIRDTKFYKSRLVPLGGDLNEAMLRYASRRKAAGHSPEENAPFFVTKLGERISNDLLQRAFRRLREQSGIHRADGSRYQPRLHDLRHSAAVHRLTTWYREGKDVQKFLPLLSTYMGHTNIGGTQHYLTMTPELLEQAGARFANYAFSEVSHG
jgi:site-specific recombinase XerD